jgi:hypothetical protein
VVGQRGAVRPGSATLTIERGATTLALKGVPARIRATCGEACFDEVTTPRLEGIAEHVRAGGVEVAVEDYAAAWRRAAALRERRNTAVTAEAAPSG